MSAIVVGPRAPLVAIDMPQIAIFIGPLIPYAHSVVLQIFNIGVACQEPQQLVYNRLQVQLFGCEQGETLLQVKTHLITKGTDSTRSGTVVFACTIVENVLQEVEILFHSGIFMAMMTKVVNLFR